MPMGALKNFGSPWLRPRLLFPTFLKDFRSNRSCECAYIIWSSYFTRFWDNREYPKNLDSPWIRQRSLFSKMFNGFLFGCTLWMYRRNLNSVAIPVPEIIAIGVLGAQQSRERGHREMVPSERAFLWALNSNFSSIFTRYRYCGFCTPLPPTCVLFKMSAMFPWDYRWMAFGLRRAKVLG